MKPSTFSFLWHMHQPQYRLRGQKSCFMPWVRLHAIRAYYDMIRVIAEFPIIRATFNLVPVLVEQIEAYVGGASDHFLDVAQRPVEDMDEADRIFLFEHFFSAQHEQMIGPMPRFAELLARKASILRSHPKKDAWKEFSDKDYADLKILFDLSWFGFKAREDFPEIERLRSQGSGFSQDDEKSVFAIEAEILKRIIPLYREAQERGQIEISTSPYAHPILPLLIDSESARDALPQAILPPPFQFKEDARNQLLNAVEWMTPRFGRRPVGLWPSEGSVSQDAAQIIAECGFSWAASDEEVLAKSLRDDPPNPHEIWELEGASKSLALVFRDRELSDRIGFTYSRREARDAAHDFVQAVVSRSQTTPGNSHVLAALDGENPWEHYPNSGADFLRSLYSEISHRSNVECIPVGEAIARTGARKKIRRLHAGSWIYANFGTWIGGPEKNRAWSILGRARHELDDRLHDPKIPEEKRQQAWAELRCAEGSDWFWWLDGQFVSSFREQFDESFRAHLREAYEALNVEAPDFLTWFIPAAKILPGRGTDEAFEWISPKIDGFEGDIYEWQGALRVPWSSLTSSGTMHRLWRPIRSLAIGFSEAGAFLLRLDPYDYPAKEDLKSLKLELAFRAEETVRKIRIQLNESGDLAKAELFAEETVFPTMAKAISRKIVEIEFPCEEVRLLPGRASVLLVTLRSGDDELTLREIPFMVPDPSSLAAADGAP